MIYDCFLFFNELDLLKIRLDELKNKVDKFVLVEATRTFAGRKKPLYFQENKHAFKEYLDRIIYYPVKEYPVPMNDYYRRKRFETFQRNCIKKALWNCDCSDKDTILISDVDEIPRAEKIDEAVDLLENNEFVIFMQRFYVFFLNWPHRDTFCGTVACKYHTLKYASPDDIRWGIGHGRGMSLKQRAGVISKHADINYPRISNGGWHFSFFGGLDAFLYKTQNYSHVVLDITDEYKLPYIRYSVCRSNLHNNRRFRKQWERYYNLFQIYPYYRDYVKTAVRYGDPLGTDSSLPQYLRTHINEYKYFFLFSEPYYDSDVKIAVFGKWYKIRINWLRNAQKIFLKINRFKLQSKIYQRFASLRYIQKQQCAGVAIIFIGTGKYIDYFQEYYSAIKNLFLPSTRKAFFVFTDQMNHYSLLNKKDIHSYYIEPLDFPFPLLFKYKYINQIASRLESYSHMVYMDADMRVNSLITEREFFSHNKLLFGVHHPSFTGKSRIFETNPISSACIRKNEDTSIYWQSCLWGGKIKNVLDLVSELASRVNADLSRDFIAVWHDESHLNKYFIENKNIVHTFPDKYALLYKFGNINDCGKILHAGIGYLRFAMK